MLYQRRKVSIELSKSIITQKEPNYLSIEESKINNIIILNTENSGEGVSAVEFYLNSNGKEIKYRSNVTPFIFNEFKKLIDINRYCNLNQVNTFDCAYEFLNYARHRKMIIRMDKLVETEEELENQIRENLLLVRQRYPIK